MNTQREQDVFLIPTYLPTAHLHPHTPARQQSQPCPSSTQHRPTAYVRTGPASPDQPPPPAISTELQGIRIQEPAAWLGGRAINNRGLAARQLRPAPAWADSSRGWLALAGRLAWGLRLCCVRNPPPVVSGWAEMPHATSTTTALYRYTIPSCKPPGKRSDEKAIDTPLQA